MDIIVATIIVSSLSLCRTPVFNTVVSECPVSNTLLRLLNRYGEIWEALAWEERMYNSQDEEVIERLINQSRDIEDLLRSWHPEIDFHGDTGFVSWPGGYIHYTC